MKLRRVNRKMMYFVSFVACILVVNVGSLIVSHANENDVIVKYRTYTNESGWQDDAQQGGDCAKDSKEALTGMKMMVVTSDDIEVNGNVKYSVYSKEANWSEEVSSGSKATAGDKPIKAIKVVLSGTLSNDYDIEYRACTSNNEWLAWEKNGSVSGNVNGNANIIAIQAKMTKKVNVEQADVTSDTSNETASETNNTQDAKAVTSNTVAAEQQEKATSNAQTSDSENQTMVAFYNKVVSQIGQTRNSAGNTVYGEWWAKRVNSSDFKDAAWCAMFLSWCANEAGISEKAIGYYAACSHWQEFYEGNGRWHLKNGYTPKKGDLIFFDYTEDGKANHNGIVESVANGIVTTIEGNVDDVVQRVEYALNEEKILGYAEPDYEKNAQYIEEANKEKQKQEAEQKNKEETGSTAEAASKGQADAILKKAIGEIGYKQGYGQSTKYGVWYGDNIIKSNSLDSAAWCAMFVTWCANEAGIPADIIKPYSYCPDGINNFKKMEVYYKKSGYTPKPGDIVFFGFGSTYADGTPRTDHTGIVEYVKDGYVHTVEGNTDFMVARRQYPLNSGYVWGYGSPKYK